MKQTAPIEIKLNEDPVSRKKMLRSIANTGFLQVWEGAVRSSKTVIALVAFAFYVTRSPERTFLLSARTVSTAETNCILDDYGLLNLIPGSQYKKVGESRAIIFNATTPDGRIVEKKIRVAGASDIRAYMSIRGNTYGGWFADEINMHDQEFVAEALRRTAMSTDRQQFWTLNPDNPNHWCYTDYIDYYDAMSKADKRKLGGFHLWHFVPADNPAMTPAMLTSLEMQYPKGTYLYDRYILGKRCVAEGLIYPLSTDNFFRDFDIKDVDIRYCAIDFGTDHPTVMTFGGMFKGNKEDWRVCAEYFDEKSDKTTYDHYIGFLDMCKKLNVDPNRMMIAIDPSANVLRKEFLQHGIPVKRAKNDVRPGIDFIRRAIYTGRLIFHPSLVHTRKEFGTYSWDPKASEHGDEKPIKIGDDCMDSVRYLGFTFIEPVVKW